MYLVYTEREYMNVTTTSISADTTVTYCLDNVGACASVLALGDRPYYLVRQAGGDRGPWKLSTGAREVSGQPVGGDHRRAEHTHGSSPRLRPR